MQRESLIDFFAGRKGGAELALEVESEIGEYEALMEKKGSSRPVYLTGEGQMRIGKEHVLMLCDACEEGDLREIAVCYIADILFMDEGFEPENEDIETVLSYLGDLDVSGDLGHGKLPEIGRQWLNS